VQGDPAKPGCGDASSRERNDTFAFGDKDGAVEAHGDVAHAAIADLAAQEDLASSVGTFEASRHERVPIPRPCQSVWPEEAVSARLAVSSG